MDTEYTTIEYALDSTRDDAFMQGRKAGIKEVVDWVDKNWLDSSNLKQWQAELKEWGM